MKTNPGQLPGEPGASILNDPKSPPVPLRVRAAQEGSGLEAYLSLAVLTLLPVEQATWGQEGTGSPTWLLPQG